MYNMVDIEPTKRDVTFTMELTVPQSLSFIIAHSVNLLRPSDTYMRQ